MAQKPTNYPIAILESEIKRADFYIDKANGEIAELNARLVELKNEIEFHTSARKQTTAALERLKNED